MCVAACAALALKQAAQPVYVPPNPEPFVLLVAEIDDELARLAAGLVDGGSVTSWADTTLDVLLAGHAEAHLLGQKNWGEASQSMADARAAQVVKVGRSFVDPRTGRTVKTPGEEEYLAGFARDLLAQDPRYFGADGLDEDAILARMRMYEGKLRGTEGWGCLDPSPPQTLWKWVLGATEDHCQDCPYNASLVAVTAGEWYTTPGACDTICLFNCQCHLEAVGKDVSTASPVTRSNA